MILHFLPDLLFLGRQRGGWGGSLQAPSTPCQEAIPPRMQGLAQPPKCLWGGAGAAEPALGGRGLRGSGARPAGRAEAQTREQHLGQLQVQVSFPWERFCAMCLVAAAPSPLSWGREPLTHCRVGSRTPGSLALRRGSGQHRFSLKPGEHVLGRPSTLGGSTHLASGGGQSPPTDTLPAPRSGPRPWRTWSAGPESMKVLCPGPAWRPRARQRGGNTGVRAAGHIPESATPAPGAVPHSWPGGRGACPRDRPLSGPGAPLRQLLRARRPSPSPQPPQPGTHTPVQDPLLKSDIVPGRAVVHSARGAFPIYPSRSGL